MSLTLVHFLKVVFRLFVFYLFIYLFILLFIYLFIYLSVYLSIYLFWVGKIDPPSYFKKN